MQTTTAFEAASAAFIYPDFAHPYYIVAPPYIRTSAGIRALHLLCHALNRRGQVAYMIQEPALRPIADAGGPDLLTPFLTAAIAQDHFDRGLVPITVYPETIAGNPLAAPCVVRYVLNFPGLLGGDAVYDPTELCFSYSETIAAKTSHPENVLFVPATDTRIFKPPLGTAKRSGSCFYGDKYKNVHLGRFGDVTRNSIEITRDLPGSQTPQEVADLFYRSEVFYTYENTALAIEAVLCGCPAVFLPNPHLTEIIAARELGPEGYAWGDTPDEIARAKASVDRGTANYLSTYDRFWRDLERFVAVTQVHAEDCPFVAPVRVPVHHAMVPMGNIVLHMLRERGVVFVAGKAFRKLGRMARARLRRPQAAGGHNPIGRAP